MPNSKAQYERRLGKWGFVKKTTKGSWQIGSHKIEKRKKEGKDTLVYRDGVLVPPDKVTKEISRQGRLTTLESLQMANGTKKLIHGSKRRLLILNRSVTPYTPGLRLSHAFRE